VPSNRPENERAFRKPGKGPGRPTALTQALTATVVRYLKDGAYLETACAAAGIGKSTLHRWLKQAAEDDKAGELETPAQEFRDAVEEALAQAELDDLGKISKAAKKGNWSAAAWRLERRFPKRWGTRKALMIPDDEDDRDSSTFTLNYALDDDASDETEVTP